jgi:hypothetical protein
MGDGKDAQAGLSRCREQEIGDLQRLPLHPGLKPGRRQEVVEHHGQLVALLGRIERVHVKDADTLKGRRLNPLDERGKVEIFSRTPGCFKDVGYEDMFPALERVRMNA